MRIEDNKLIFSTGKEIQASYGMVSLDRDGDIALLDEFEELHQPDNLTEEERWELAKYMRERWDALAKKIWDRHKDTMYQAPVETNQRELGDILEEAKLPIWTHPFRFSCMGVSYITKDHIDELVKIAEGNKVDYNLEKDERVFSDRKEEPLDSVLESLQSLAIWMTGCGYDFTQHPYYMKNQYLFTVGIEKERECDQVEESEEKILNDLEANKELLKDYHCPECTSLTIIGLHKRDDEKGWDIVEGRYCPICNWKDKKPVGPPNEVFEENPFWLGNKKLAEEHGPVLNQEEVPARLDGTFDIEESDRILHDLAKEYHDRCDAFDRAVCTGSRKGVPMPNTGDEMTKLNLNAQIVRGDIKKKGSKQGFLPETIDKAIQEYRRNR